MIDPDSLDLPEVVFDDGALILVEGVRHDRLLVLLEGSVSVSAAGAPISTIDSRGAVFGEMAFLLDSPATATVAAVGQCRFKQSDAPARLLREHPDMALEIATTLARRLDLVTRYLADLRNQYADRGDHLSVVDDVLGSLVHASSRPERPGSEREPDAPY